MPSRAKSILSLPPIKLFWMVERVAVPSALRSTSNQLEQGSTMCVSLYTTTDCFVSIPKTGWTRDPASRHRKDRCYNQGIDRMNVLEVDLAPRSIDAVVARFSKSRR